MATWASEFARATVLPPSAAGDSTRVSQALTNVFVGEVRQQPIDWQPTVRSQSLNKVRAHEDHTYPPKHRSTSKLVIPDIVGRGEIAL